MSAKLTLGERIKRAVSESPLSAKEVATGIGISPQAISNAIRKGLMGDDNLRKLAEITGVSEDWLLNGEKPESDEFKAELMSRCIVAVKKAAAELGMDDLDEEKVTHAALMLYKANL